MADENKKGITVKIDADLHAQVKEYIESRGMTMAEFITAACDDLLHPKIAEKEEKKIGTRRRIFNFGEAAVEAVSDDQEQEDTVPSEDEETACESEAEEESASEEYGDYDDDELEDESEDEEESTGMVMGM